MPDATGSSQKLNPLDDRVLELLACPVCYGKLRADLGGAAIVCGGCERKYPVVDGIPVLIAGRDISCDRRE